MAFKLPLFAAIAAAALCASSPAIAANTDTIAKWSDTSAARADYSAWGTFLEKYVVAGENGDPNRVRYGEVSKADRQQLKDYVETLAAIDPTALSRNDAFAYWANLYNALTVNLILDHYPVKSIRKIKPSIFAIGPWGMDAVTVNGETLTLDDIEHKILRGHFKDNRVHYAVNCASVSCPNLRKEPFDGARLDDQLNEAAHDYVNSPRGAALSAKGRLTVSSIYKWFRKDFGGDEQGVIAHLSLYAEPALQKRLKSADDIDGYDYDWSLNDVR